MTATETIDAMGMVTASIELINADDIGVAERGFIPRDNVRRMAVPMLVDNGAYMLCINENIRIQLGLKKLDEQSVQLADGTLRTLDVVGPIEVRFENRRTTVDGMVLPGDTEPLLGAIPMEGLDVCIQPREQKLVVNPLSPYMARKSLK